MSEDNRIPEIRAIVDEYVRPDDLDALHAVRRRIRAILDSAPPAPRVFFPGDTVPAGRMVTFKGASFTIRKDHEWRVLAMDGPVVEVTPPSPEEWQVAVDRARATTKRCRCGVRPGAEHVRNCAGRCQDCGGDPDGPRRCRCRASEERAIPEPTEGNP